MEIMEQFFEDHGAYLYRYAYFLGAHPDTAAELVQRTMIQVWKKQDQLRSHVALRSWIRTICLNEFRMMMRKNKTLHEDEFTSIEELEEDGKLMQVQPIDVVHGIVVSEEVEQMRNGCFLAMARKLTLPQRMAFSLCDMFGLSIQEAALLLDISQGALKGLLYRARMNLDAFFADHCHFMKEENSCRCVAWRDFTQDRAKLQTVTSFAFSALAFQEKGYAYQHEVRGKVALYYQQMPFFRPDEQWFQQLLELIKNTN